LIYQTYIPAPPLSSFVDLFWFNQGYVPPHAMERILPDGSMSLIINLREDRVRAYNRETHGECGSLRGSLIAGAYSEFSIIDTKCQESTLGVHFRPGGASAFFRLPACELRNQDAGLEEFWGVEAFHLREQLLQAETPAMKFRMMEKYLFEHFEDPSARHSAVRFALREFQLVPHARTVAEVTNQIGLSPKRFIQRFNDEVGLTPKLFCRVRRFQQVLKMIGDGRVDWAAVAASCGYFDQAHFIHDFQSFSGLNPTTYVARRGEYYNHVPLAD
jgi:AraC-like DNA-binding protein